MNKSFSLYNLTPDSTYEFKIYGDDSLEAGVTDIALPATTVNIREMLSFVGNDISPFTDTILSISSISADVFDTGDVITTNINDISRQFTRTVTFVNNSELLDISSLDGVLMMPFNTGGGPGQSVDVLLKDRSTATVSYDETTDAITVESSSRQIGDVSVYNGQKVTVFDS